MRATLTIFTAAPAALLACGPAPDGAGPGPSPAGPSTATGPQHVGRAVCASCHPQQAERFAGSDHDLAMDEATAETLLGDFSGVEVEHRGATTTFFREDGEPRVRTEGPDGETAVYPVPYVFGVRPLQQLLLPLEGGRLQSFGLAWDARPAAEGGQRWFHLYPDEDLPPGDPLHWTGVQQTWNFMCAECHSTNLEKRWLDAERRYDTRWFEIDVSCEACHGPGSGHVAWVERARSARPGDGVLEDPTRGLAVTFPRAAVDGSGERWVRAPDQPTAARVEPLPDRDELETCARCHSRRGQAWPEYVHGHPLADTHRVALLDEGLYFPDGQIEDEVYVYGSFLQSRMHAAGVTCSDCHDPHSGRLRAEGNALCNRCHDPAVFDVVEHHRHPPDTPGASCVECHAPERTYMGVDPRRDHSFRVPRPDLTLALGAPNACNRCHDDRGAEWALEAVRGWHGGAREVRFHYGRALFAARERDPDAPALLLRAFDDPETPAIARATALAAMRPVPGTPALEALARGARDPDPLVRRAAASLLPLLEPAARAALGAVLLDDPVRTVRLEATPALVGLPLPGLETAVAELRASEASNADRAESHLNVGNLEARLGRPREAEAAYRRALEREPGFLPALVNLADLYRGLQRDEQAEALLREAVERHPRAAEAHHALGLCRVRRGDLDGALAHLERAFELAPEEPRFGYVLAVALRETGELARAVGVLERTQAAAPGDPEVLALLAASEDELGRPEAAARWRGLLEASVPRPDTPPGPGDAR